MQTARCGALKPVKAPAVACDNSSIVPTKDLFVMFVHSSAPINVKFSVKAYIVNPTMEINKFLKKINFFYEQRECGTIGIFM